MAFYIMGEPKYRSTGWYINNLHGLNVLLHKKRIPGYDITSASDIKRRVLSDIDALILFGTDTQWLCETARQLKPCFGNRIIIYGINDTVTNLCSNEFNTVSADLFGEINTVYNYLTSHGKKKIALYGVTPDSLADEIRKNYFLACGNRESDIYYHKSTLERCFNGFIGNIGNYDAVICANPYSAISLFDRFGGTGELFIACCGSSPLFEFPLFTNITHTYNPTESSNIIFDVYRMILNNRTVSSINVYMSSDLFIGETTDYLPRSDKSRITVQSAFKNNLVFYSDREVNEMLKIELLISNCDEIDLMILERILENATYSQISDELYMSTNGIKYKLKKMFVACNVSSKKELCGLFKKYINR